RSSADCSGPVGTAEGAAAWLQRALRRPRRGDLGAGVTNVGLRAVLKQVRRVSRTSTIGRFESRSEVVRHAMRLLEEDEYKRKYIHQDKDFSAIFSTYARLHYLQREYDYPSSKTRKTESGEFTSEVLGSSIEILDQRIENHAGNNDGAPLARDDSRRAD
ncbi:MAG TPA: type II toxin-antitoxin system ParD family antitoxin, partial [Reyranella sp.]